MCATPNYYRYDVFRFTVWLCYNAVSVQYMAVNRVIIKPRIATACMYIRDGGGVHDTTLSHAFSPSENRKITTTLHNLGKSIISMMCFRVDDTI